MEGCVVRSAEDLLARGAMVGGPSDGTCCEGELERIDDFTERPTNARLCRLYPGTSLFASSTLSRFGILIAAQSSPCLNAALLVILGPNPSAWVLFGAGRALNVMLLVAGVEVWARANDNRIGSVWTSVEVRDAVSCAISDASTESTASSEEGERGVVGIGVEWAE